MKLFATIFSVALVLGLLLFSGCTYNGEDNEQEYQSSAVVDESECADGVCPLPVPPNEPDLSNPDIRFDTGECFTLLVDDAAVKALGATREEVMLAIFDARTNGKYKSIEELLNLTVNIKGKDVPIKSLVKIKK